METAFLNLWNEWLWPILQFVVGLGVVIFVHELGHFIVAKAVDMRVEQFALGFGTRLLGFKKGETEYRLNLIPMGGYVKLTGQEDFGPLKDEASRDPRSFPNKPIRSRFAVIAAGVVMNVILAAVLFIVVCVAGIRFPAPVIGRALPGSPAEEAKIHWLNESMPVSVGLKPGDRILQVDGEPITRFNELTAIAALADADHEFTVRIGREKDDRLIEGVTQIRAVEMGGTLNLGLIPAASTTLGGLGDTISVDPFQEGDEVLAIEGQPIRHHWQIPELEERLDGSPVTLAILRDHKEMEVRIRPTLRIKPGVFFMKDGDRISGEITDYRPEDGVVVIRLPDGTEKTVPLEETVWPARSEILDILGLVPRLRVSGVIKDSPAYHAGLRPGDVILKYGEKPSPTLGEFLQINDRVAETGTTIVILRDNQRMTLEIRPARHQGRVVVGITAGLDLENPVVGSVRDGSPAAVAGTARGDRVIRVNGRETADWTGLFEALKSLQGQDIVISLKRNDTTETEARFGSLSRSVFDPEDYRYILFPGPRGFTVLMGEEVRKNPAAAVLWGFRETWNFITLTYATLVSYFRGTVSSSEFSGPVGIGSIAIQAGREGIVPFIYFMAVISVSIAVLNFLPIPVVDGGHAVFLLIEKILGRPVPLKVQNAVTMVGWALMILVFVALTWNDISRILSNTW